MLKAAVAIDTGFASAHRLPATTYNEMGDRVRSADARDHAMDNFFVFRSWPTSHSAATPINSMPDVVIGVGAFLEVEK